MPFLRRTCATKQTQRPLPEAGLRHVYSYIAASNEAAFAVDGAVTVESVSVRLESRGISRPAGWEARRMVDSGPIWPTFGDWDGAPQGIISEIKIVIHMP